MPGQMAIIGGSCCELRVTVDNPALVSMIVTVQMEPFA